jgi:hypothetical protein
VKTKTWLVLAILGISVLSIVVVMIYYSALFVPRRPTVEGKDLFGIDEIYSTKEGGREWYVDMENPFSDDLFSNTFEHNITRQEDGSWRVSGPAVRLNVGTPSNSEVWKNVEITGYAKVIDSISSSAATNDSRADDSDNGEEEEKDFVSDLDWRARGGRHSHDNPCEGTAYTGTIDINGNVRWKKEIWHTGGYTDARAVEKVTDSIIGRWIGWKVAMYNINNNNNNNSTAVKLESYLDDKNNNEWRKVTDLVDDGGWYANSSDKEFYSANCSRPKDYIITNGGPRVTFRSDNTIWDFKNLSVREISPPSS